MRSAVAQVSDKFSGLGCTASSQASPSLSKRGKEKTTIGEEFTLALNRISDPEVVDPMQLSEDFANDCGHQEARLLHQPIAGVGDVTEEPDLKCETSRAETAYNSTMTIFYAGQIVVIKDLPASKAHEIFQLAAGAPDSAPCTRNNTSTANDLFHTPGLPTARKNSIARFLEERKDRMIRNAPKRPAYDQQWLSLSPPRVTGQN